MQRWPDMLAVYEQAVRIGLPVQYYHNERTHVYTYDDRPVDNAEEYMLELPNENEFFSLTGIVGDAPHSEWFWVDGQVRMGSWNEDPAFLEPPAVEFAKWLARNRAEGCVGETQYEFRLGGVFNFSCPPLLVVCARIVWPDTTQYLMNVFDDRLAGMVADALMGRVGPGIAFDYFLDHYQDKLETVPF